MTIQTEMQDDKVLQDAAALIQPLQTIKACVQVTGERNKHLGPMWDFAKVDVYFEPAATLEIVNLVKGNKLLQDLGFPDNVIRGILDVITLSNSLPITALKIVIKNVYYNDIDSSSRALFEAGRDAGKKLLSTLECHQ